MFAFLGLLQLILMIWWIKFLMGENPKDTNPKLIENIYPSSIGHPFSFDECPKWEWESNKH